MLMTVFRLYLPQETVKKLRLKVPDTNEPLVAKSLATSWPACKLWTLDYLKEAIKSAVKFRLSKKQTPYVHWEPDCLYISASIEQFRDWLKGPVSPENPFHAYSPKTWWAYADYVYMTPEDTNAHNVQCSYEKELTSSMVTPLRLKCKFRTGQCVLSNLTSESTLWDLMNSVSTAVGVNTADLTLFVGYPPKQLTCSGELLNRKLHQVPLISGDTLTVDTLKSTNSTPANSVQNNQSVRDHALSAIAATSLQSNHSAPDSGDPHIVRLTAPSDNSCLFTSVLFCVQNADGRLPIGTQVVTNPGAVAQIRELIGSIVLSDPDRYSEAFLGMPNARYCQCIQEVIACCLVAVLFELARVLTVPLAAEARAAWNFTDTATFSLFCRECHMPLVGQKAAQQHAKETGHAEFSEVPTSSLSADSS
ncbi:hypothetical protein AHF37_00787 [Paragonimus kellicotti]|nr:hypothetical protein AHF37_00787 [Paragonimus kellicotti]